MCAKVTSTYMEFTLAFGPKPEFSFSFKSYFSPCFYYTIYKNISQTFVLPFFKKIVRLPHHYYNIFMDLNEKPNSNSTEVTRMRHTVIQKHVLFQKVLPLADLLPLLPNNMSLLLLKNLLLVPWYNPPALTVYLILVMNYNYSQYSIYCFIKYQ